VHVPFCARACDFCAFYQKTPTAQDVRSYLQTLRNEAALVAWNQPVSTVFFGGGTPGLLAPRDLATLCAHVSELCSAASSSNSGGNGAAVRGVATLAEWTVEVAPASVTGERLAVLRDAGVTRISMGAQSFQPALLDALGRRHTREQVFHAWDRVRSAGFASVNLDLMFALPGQDETAWLADLEQAIALAPDHLSTYCLTFEEDTKLWLKLSQGHARPDPGHEAHLYKTTWSRLAAAGYAQYEISNFARPGHASIHNLNTWRMHSWIGLGPSAASQHAGWRGSNIADLDRWRQLVETGHRATQDRTSLTPALLMEDAVIFGLRMNEGVDFRELARRFPGAEAAASRAVLEATAGRFVADGLAEWAAPVGVGVSVGGRASVSSDLADDFPASSRRLRLTPRGRLVADAVGAELIGTLTSTVP
jgi:oxygen-independent coproporphyrinogen-3 oxidase